MRSKALHLANRSVYPLVAALAITYGLSAAQLTAKLHFSIGDAIAIYSLLQGVGVLAVVAIYPTLAPVIGTLKLILAFAGYSAFIGF